MVREPFIAVEGDAETDTAGAVCLTNVEYLLNGALVEVLTDFWIPKANLLDHSLDTVDEAVRGERIEIYVAKWWLEAQ